MSLPGGSGRASPLLPDALDALEFASRTDTPHLLQEWTRPTPRSSPPRGHSCSCVEGSGGGTGGAGGRAARSFQRQAERLGERRQISPGKIPAPTNVLGHRQGTVRAQIVDLAARVRFALGQRGEFSPHIELALEI